MPQEKYRITSKAKFDLLRSIDHYLGLFVRTKSDCAILSSVLTGDGYDYLSESTLYRLLVKPQSNHLPSLHTLNTLAQFCCFPDWFTMERFAGNYYQYNQYKDQQYGLSDYTAALLRSCIHQKNFRPVAEFFDQDFSDCDGFYLDRILGFEIFRIMADSPGNNIDFYRQFYKHPLLRRIFFEHNTDPDCRIKQHAEGMQLYLSASKPESGADGLQDYIFANCLLLRYYFKKGNYPRVLELGKTLYECEDFDVESLIFYPRFRYHAYKLLYYKARNLTEKCRYQEQYILWYFRRNAAELKESNLFFRDVNNITRPNRLQNHATAALSIFGDAFTLAGSPQKVKAELLETAYQPDNLLFKEYAPRGLQKILPSLEVNVPYVYQHF
jgi:hypothetical protein